MMKNIYILLSIKTRIETQFNIPAKLIGSAFISYYPLKQGLKRDNGDGFTYYREGFISYYPLKQGLKH